MSNKLYVGNLPFTVSEAEIRELFGQYGAVAEVFIPTDRETHRPRGFAFVTMQDAESAGKAVDGLNGYLMGERNLAVSEARPQEARPPGGGGGRRDFGGGGGGGRRGGGGGGGDRRGGGGGGGGGDRRGGGGRRDFGGRGDD